MRLSILHEFQQGEPEKLSDVVRNMVRSHKKFQTPITIGDIKNALGQKSSQMATDDSVIRAVHDALKMHGVDVIK
jgi:hypothetical protein